MLNLWVSADSGAQDRGVVVPSGRSWPAGRRAAGSRWAALPAQGHSPDPPDAPQSDRRSPGEGMKTHHYLTHP